jgi:hypothetical protein
MTPKEKAQELFDKYFEVTNNYYQAKQCALIAVDEILDTVKWCIGDSQVGYWQDVKKEIELL